MRQSITRARRISSRLILFIGAVVCQGAALAQGKKGAATTSDSLPAPHATKSSMNFSNVKGWEGGRTPNAPAGFSVVPYATGFDNPRWLYITPNGDVLVAESNTYHPWWEKLGAHVIGASKSNSMRNSADRITLLRDTNQDGMPDVRETFLDELNQPFGMLVLGEWFYVANTDALLRYPYKPGQTRIDKSEAQKVVDLPAGNVNRHWTRNIIANKEGTKIFIAVGSGSNVAEKGIDKELLRAAILEINPDGSGLRVYASGLRNPVGMDWAVGTHTLWTSVNERDELGDDLVPDYLTHVEEDGFYGWPYVYHGQHRDDRVKLLHSAQVKDTRVPDVDLGSHTASLGLAFYTKDAFPAKYREGAFIAQHGSWNRSQLSGYRVVFIPFDKGKPTGKREEFLGGFIADLDKEKVYGRPVGVVVTPTGALLVTDDVSNTVWKVSYGKGN